MLQMGQNRHVCDVCVMCVCSKPLLPLHRQGKGVRARGEKCRLQKRSPNGKVWKRASYLSSITKGFLHPTTGFPF